MRNIYFIISRIVKDFKLFIFLIILVIGFSCKPNETTKEESDDQNSPVISKADSQEVNEGNITQDKPDTLAFCIKEGVGMGGYDPVNYISSNGAAKGDKSISTSYRGVEYQFINDDNKNLFLSDPEKYLPAYGGWCAMTLSMGRATTPVYDNFLIIDGKLHLFERTVSVNGRTLWQQDPDLNAQRAQKHYDDYKVDGVIIVEE